jgi:acetyltransferase-like isoleucine patch superfamily enzyme
MSGFTSRTWSRAAVTFKKWVALSRVRPLSAVLRIELGPGVEIDGRAWIPGTGRIHLGRGVRLRGRQSPIELRAHEGAEIRLEEGVTVEGGASIEATRRVEVGARTSIGAFSKIIDNHYHHTVGDRTVRPAGVAVLVGEDAVIGPRVILLPGARVAARAVLGPGQVLSGRQEFMPAPDRRSDMGSIA